VFLFKTPHAEPKLACIAAACIALAGCAPAEAPDAADLNRAYEEALRATAPPASVMFEVDGVRERAVMRRLEYYFAGMTPLSVEEQTAAVYAPTAILYDNLAVINGLPAIQGYFAKAASDVDGLQVEFLQVARADVDYFVRWRMTIESARLAAEPLVSYGVTQFRFDNEGRVLLHRDFWDAATGLYEYLPGIGGAIAGLRHRLAEHD